MLRNKSKRAVCFAAAVDQLQEVFFDWLTLTTMPNSLKTSLNDFELMEQVLPPPLPPLTRVLEVFHFISHIDPL